jgi:uncharacterized lipoprotein NlpE involved in copper resistance
MRTAVKTVLLVGMCVSFGLTACKKGKDTETPVDASPSRPPSPSGTMSLHGTYTQVGTSGTFRDCTTGERWPVAHEGDNGALEQAYLGSGVQPGPLVVTVEGGIDYRPRADGNRREMMLIVARFVRIGPGETCPTTKSTPKD